MDWSHAAEECNEPSWCWAYRSSADEQVIGHNKNTKQKRLDQNPSLHVWSDTSIRLCQNRSDPRTSASDPAAADPIEHRSSRAEPERCNPAAQNGPQGRWGTEPAALGEWINTFITPHMNSVRGFVGKQTLTFSSNGHWDVSKLATLDSGLMRKSPLSWISWWQQLKKMY